MKKKKININIKLDLKLKLFLFLFAIVFLILIGLIISSTKEQQFKISNYQNNQISFNYDQNFTITEEKEYIELKSQDNQAIVVIKILDYTNTYKKENQSDIASSLSYQVIKDESDYIETYNDYEIKNDYTRYYYLYENYEKENQIEVITTFTNHYIYTLIYSANNNEFDLYEESISLIVNSIEIEV